MNIFKPKKTEKTPDKKVTPELPGNSFFEELNDLGQSESRRVVTRAKSDAEATISDAAVQEIRNRAVIERGRCPDCGGRTVCLLFASVCSSCGWYKQTGPSRGRCVVHLERDEPIECDQVFEIQGDHILCVRDNMAICQVARNTVRRIDFHLSDELLAAARERYHKEESGVCAWCDQNSADSQDEKGPYEEFVAFGSFQERYIFCSKKCLAAFRKQYPVRIHRNCYETDCNACSECARQYDTIDFKRVELE